MKLNWYCDWRVPPWRLTRESFAESQEIVRFVTQTEEAAADAADAAVEADRVAALLFYLQIDVDLRSIGCGFTSASSGFDLFEISELVQSLQAHVPQLPN